MSLQKTDSLLNLISTKIDTIVHTVKNIPAPEPTINNFPQPSGTILGLPSYVWQYFISPATILLLSIFFTRWWTMRTENIRARNKANSLYNYVMELLKLNIGSLKEHYEYFIQLTKDLSDIDTKFFFKHCHTDLNQLDKIKTEDLYNSLVENRKGNSVELNTNFIELMNLIYLLRTIIDDYNSKKLLIKNEIDSKNNIAATELKSLFDSERKLFHDIEGEVLLKEFRDKFNKLQDDYLDKMNEKNDKKDRLNLIQKKNSLCRNFSHVPPIFELKLEVEKALRSILDFQSYVKYTKENFELVVKDYDEKFTSFIKMVDYFKSLPEK